MTPGSTGYGAAMTRRKFEEILEANGWVDVSLTDVSVCDGRKRLTEIIREDWRDDLPPICDECVDEGRETPAAAVWLGTFYCLDHAYEYKVADLARWWNRGREMGLGA